MRSLHVRVRESLVACVLLLGCSGASWQKVAVEPGYQPPKVMTVTVIARASLREASAALGEALVDELNGHGIKATLVPETAGTPDANITLEKFEPGSRALRWAIGFGSGEGQVVVSVESASANGDPGIDGTARGWVRGGFFGGSDNNSAAAAGQLIAETIANGQREADQRANNAPSDSRHTH